MTKYPGRWKKAPFGRGFRRPRSAAGLLLAMIVAAVTLAGQWWRSRDQQGDLPAGGEANCRINRVVDGDTLLLEDHTRVRLIGVNTPETVKPEHPVEPWGPEAAQFSRDFTSGGAVRLVFDKERTDKYGRTLAYVYVGDQMLNEELLRAGLGRSETQYHFSAAMKRRFLAAETEAQAARRGIWSQGLSNHPHHEGKSAKRR